MWITKFRNVGKGTLTYHRDYFCPMCNSWALLHDELTHGNYTQIFCYSCGCWSSLNKERLEEVKDEAV